jgi:Fur family ferric uptake transcriptional regulator
MTHELERKALARFLESHHLKQTKQREVILEAFLETGDHVTGEDLYQKIRERYPRIGYTTVYRTLKLFVEAGLAEEHHFDDGVTRYEMEHEHHDHLVCTLCGKILEFESALIERAQKEIAEGLGFVVLRHRHELYGHCSDCRENETQS